ncbi:MAG: TonB-dependent receptor [Bacteroides sp.]
MNYKKIYSSVLTLIFLAFCCVLDANAQTYLEGRVVSQSEPEGVAGALVYLRGTSYGAYTESDGTFRFAYKGALPDSLIVESIGYERIGVALAFYPNCDLHIALHSSSLDIESVRITANYAASKQRATTQTLRVVGAELIAHRRAPTLSQTLEQVAGVHAMSIGNGASKPMIRGMGFNRIAVLDRGVKQEGQQWGADHGLELDQMSVEHVGVYKGATSLRFGGDAMGGAIVVNADIPHPEDGVHGKGALWYASNSQLGGISLKSSYAGRNFFYSLTLTGTDYGDYAVPVDTIVYLTRKLPIYNQSLKNTAGFERDISLTLGMEGELGILTCTGSYVQQRMGFFPGSHGLPSLERLQPDKSTRNIAFPYSDAQHTKMILNYRTNPQGRSWTSYVDLGVQYNTRAEFSAFHTHYPNQPPPRKNKDLELWLGLWTYSMSERTVWKLTDPMQLEVGTDLQYQHHDMAGYSFLLPHYERTTAGIYATYSWQILPNLKIETGIRGDWGHLHIHRYYDEILHHYLQSRTELEAEHLPSYAQLSPELSRIFLNYSGACGISWRCSESQLLKFHAGRSFRLPSVHELAANGIHHGSFRHERGDKNINSETGYQLDLEYIYTLKNWRFGLNPFASYYTNYIFMTPSLQWSILPDAGQIYQFSQSRVFSFGGELEIHGHLLQSLSFSGNASFVFLENLTDGYPIPFTPPATFRGVLSWQIPWISTRIGIFTLEGEGHYVTTQNRVARNELPTDGSLRVDALISYKRKVGNVNFTLRGGCKNLSNAVYFNHLSYYRTLEIPEPGRSWNIDLAFEF